MITLEQRFCMAMEGPNPMVVAWSIMRSLRRVDRPRPSGLGIIDHATLAEALSLVADGQTAALPETQPHLAEYVSLMESVDPDALDRDESLAFWINVYNAGALQLAGSALAAGSDSVLRIPGGFQNPFIHIRGVDLSLDDIEHAKVRRFGDPRVHGALVCGSVSCPTLRAEPYSGQGLTEQLDHQMRYFLTNGGAIADVGTNKVHLSRVFSWFGSDFVRPHRMPTFVPSRTPRVVAAIAPYLSSEIASLLSNGASVRYQPYDWGLRCAVA